MITKSTLPLLAAAVLVATVMIGHADQIVTLHPGSNTVTCQVQGIPDNTLGGGFISGLNGGTSIGTADNLQFFDPVLGTYQTFWYKNGGVGGTGWRSPGLSNVNAASWVWNPGEDAFIQQKGSVDSTLTLTGSPRSVVWKGAVSGNWDTFTSNWTANGLPTTFLNYDNVIFDDTATGTTTVNLITALAPNGVTVNGSTSYTLTGPGKLTGATGLTMNSGVLTVLTDNDYTGNTTINGGTLLLGNGGTTGSITGNIVANGGTLIFNRAGSITLAGLLSGPGVVTKNGTGSLTLTGFSASFTGATTVNSGSLLVDGLLGSGVSVNAGATLGGTGSIGGPVVIAAGSALQPGHGGTGTLTTGPTTLNGTYTCEFDSTISDCLAVAGNLDLTGAKVSFLALNPPTAVNYVIATYSGTLTGTFQVTSIPAGYEVPNGYSLDYSVPGQVRLTKPASPGINQLLSSGTIAQFADTSLYTKDGIVIKVGAVGEQLFPESEHVKAALVAAGQAGGVVAPGWQVTSYFEEWTDRIILRKATSFDMLDGGRFNNEFLGGSAFVPSGNLETDSQSQPTESEVLSMAADYIASGEHHTLYPAASAAGDISAQALMDELGKDRGPVTITETIEFARIATPLEDLGGIQPGQLPVLGQEAVAGAPLTLPQGSNSTGLNFPIHFGALTAGCGQSLPGTSGTATYSAKMLNGFTIGSEWQKSYEYSRNWYTFRTTATVTFGLGVRIPWQADVEVTPSRISCPPAPDLTPFEASIKINTLDADPAFYSAVGIPSTQIFDGQELVTRAGASITVYLKVLKKTYLNNSLGKIVDLGKNFDPPLGNTLSLGTVTIPYETTGLGWNLWYVGIGVDLGVGFGITGTRFDISVSPQNSTNLPGYTTSPQTIQVIGENVWKTLCFGIRDTSPTKWQPLSYCREFYRYGPLYENASYYTSLNVSPMARIRATIYLSKVWNKLSDINLPSNWWTITTLNFNLPKLGPHANTISRIDASTGTMRDCKRDCILFPLNLATSPIAPGSWAFRVFGQVMDGGNVTEYLPTGATLVPGSITGGGVYNAATRSISWMIASGSQVVDVSYSLASQVGEPKPVGQWQPLGTGPPLGILGSPGTTQQEADDALLTWQLAQRPTLQEVQDARAGSVIIQGQDGVVQLKFNLQISDDLIHWVTTPETLSNPITVDQPIDAAKRFFRFKVAE